ncbi:MAG: EAL domain-containing protein [Alphaproteobacteria bacterium]|nr:EAL domain-containing protein [Alphaproteobacteria bacterium]MBU6471383.1 EAL domain-containing protein [Alphaproteobacteria bacterium]MDE2014082.1 EAL domain-containing protein [Alphaproteobacteria bacterium]MDE2072231.1 EAL domain-containing protein [Alphaproteobacteria bacterium]MDE2350676.1 EAL domain-containing protein [Alphaproteobacteria bacterium]
MVNTARLLGFAFANADLLFEIDRDGTVIFATGAASEFVKNKNQQIVGSGAARLFEPSDGVKFVTYAKALSEGDRAGPIRLKLAGGRDVTASFCHLPQNGANISCTLTRTGQRQSFGTSRTDPGTGLSTKDGFLAAASAMAADGAEMMLVNVPGLEEACARLPRPKADALMKAIGAAVEEAGPKGAGRVGDGSFGAIAEEGKKPCLVECIASVLKKGGLVLKGMTETAVSLKGDLSPGQRLLAVRHVVARFSSGDSGIEGCKDLSAAFENMVGETQARALALTNTVADGAFSFAYQPVVDLASGTLSHCEALARFEDSVNTGETIAFAEALGISNAFDVAVAAKILSVVEQNPKARVALNLSGNTVSTPMTFGLVAGLLAKKRSLAPRVLVEVTESAEIIDLANANLAIQGLRSMGYKVGLDDFGAGAASFQYLHAFDVDFVKFDQALIRKLGSAPREDMLVAGLVKLCGELNVTTVAEGIENAAIKKRVLAAGFQLGQGYFLGKPSAQLPDAPSAHKRKGVQESWA